jgi:hypothetical protein
MNLLPVELITGREFHPDLAEKISQDAFFGRLYDGDMFFADKFLDFFYILFILDFNDYLHCFPPATDALCLTNIL